MQDGDVANVTFSWGPASGASDYFVFISTRGRQIIENISPAPSGQTTFGPVPLVPGDYFWHAVAKNGEGFSVDWSEPAYFSVARDPSSTAPFIAELEMPNENGDVEFTVATLIGDFVDLFVYQATNPSIEFRRSVAVSEFPFTREFPFTLNDDRFNIPNETYVFQAQPYNADGSRGLWTAANQYTVPDNGGTALGIPTEAQLLADWPALDLTVRNAASLQFQLRAFHPDPDDPDYLTFSPDDTRPAPGVFHPEDNISLSDPVHYFFNVPSQYRDPGLRTYIRARAVTANGSFGPWSPWAVHINP